MGPYVTVSHSIFQDHGCRSPFPHVVGRTGYGHAFSNTGMHHARQGKRLCSFRIECSLLYTPHADGIISRMIWLHCISIIL